MAACLLAAAPAWAGNLTFEGGQTVWHSAQCVEPNSPNSVLAVNSDTAGDDMNALIAQHNAYVDAMQAYMNCLSSEAERDQDKVSRAIAAGAQRAIAEAQAQVDNSDAVLRSHQQ